MRKMDLNTGFWRSPCRQLRMNKNLSQEEFSDVSSRTYMAHKMERGLSPDYRQDQKNFTGTGSPSCVSDGR